jgi:hypothetical protein
MTLGLTKSLTEMIIGNLRRSKGRLAHATDILTDMCESIAYKMWERRRFTKPVGLHDLLQE